MSFVYEEREKQSEKEKVGIAALRGWDEIVGRDMYGATVGSDGEGGRKRTDHPTERPVVRQSEAR